MVQASAKHSCIASMSAPVNWRSRSLGVSRVGCGLGCSFIFITTLDGNRHWNITQFRGHLKACICAVDTTSKNRRRREWQMARTSSRKTAASDELAAPAVAVEPARKRSRRKARKAAPVKKAAPAKKAAKMAAPRKATPRKTALSKATLSKATPAKKKAAAQKVPVKKVAAKKGLAKKAAAPKKR